MAQTQLDTQEPAARERWDRYLAATAACTDFAKEPSVDSAMSVCHAAANGRDCEPEIVCKAIETLEKGMRAAAKSDDGELSRSTLASLDGAWRLVLTTGVQSKAARNATEGGKAGDGEDETKNLLEQIKNLGLAGFISYALWEGGFWTLGGALGLVAYYLATGHWPDLSNSEDAGKVGAEAFAFVNLARFAVPLRIGLAIGTAPWVDENIVKRFGLGNDETQQDKPTGSKPTGRKINYFPLRATQTFNTSDMSITNGIYLGKFPLLRFFGSFDWLEDRRRLEFDFGSVAVGGLKIDLPQGGAEELGAATGLGAKNNVARAKQGKKAFFNWISADEQVATARGGGGGLALWRRDGEMESIETTPPTFMTPAHFRTDGSGLSFVPAGESQAPVPPPPPVSQREIEEWWNPDGLKLPGCVDLKRPPVYLDGSLAGDIGFDPLCLVAYANVGQELGSVAPTAVGRKSQMLSLTPEEQQRKVAWMREAELKHARLAMLAAAGWPLAELWNSEALADVTNGRAPSLFNGHLGDYGLFLFLISVVLHAIEIKSFDTMKAPGDLGFDLLNYFAGEGPTKQKEMQLAEIKNGRVAMMAITGYAVQEFLYGTPVVQQSSWFFR